MLRTPSLSACSGLKFSGEHPQLRAWVQVIVLVQWGIFLGWTSISAKLVAPQLEGTLSFNGAEEGAVLNIFIRGELQVHTNVMNCWAFVCKNVSLLGPVPQGHFKVSFKTERKTLQVGEGGAAITLLLRLSGPCWIPTACHPHRLECAREKKSLSL